MKVLDLQCAGGHEFEGWFASEDEFQAQCARQLVQCPVCGNARITKKLSAPRLNLGGLRTSVASCATEPSIEQALEVAWMAVARHIVASTDDVGARFAEEARKIHYGEAQERGIRGQATAAEKASLKEEGIAVVTLPIPDALTGPLH